MPRPKYSLRSLDEVRESISMSPQEELNRQFISSISILEVKTEELKNQMEEVKDNVAELVKQLTQIKLLFCGLILGVVANANPNEWLTFFLHAFK